MGNSSTKTTPEIPQANPHSNQPSIPLNEYFARSENLITSFGCWEPYEATLKCISKIDRASPEQKRTLEELRGDVMKNCPKELQEFRKCMLKNNAHQFIKTVQEESAKAQIQASKEAPKS